MAETREWIGFFEVNTEDEDLDLEATWIVGDAEEIAQGVRDCLKVQLVSRVVFEVTRNAEGIKHEP